MSWRWAVLASLLLSPEARPATSTSDEAGALARRYAAQPIQRTTLPNGVRVIVLPRGTVPWCALVTVLPGGAHEDPIGASGLVHLAEHLLFEEETGGLSDDDAEALGMRSNAFTLSDYLVLVEEFSPAVLEQAVAIHGQRLKRHGFGDAQLDREKQVILDERRFRVDEPPLGRADETLVRALWGEHPFGRPVLGWPDELKRIDRTALKGWARARVRPERAVVVVVGRVDGPRAFRAIEKALSGWTAEPANPADLALLAKPRAPSPAPSVEKELPGTTSAYLLATSAAPLGSAEETADRALARLLQGDPRRHFDGAREVWPGIELRAEYRPQAHAGELVVTALPHGTASLDDTATFLDEALQSLAARGPSARSLDAARVQLAAEHVRSLTVHASLAERIAVDEALLGKWDAEASRLHALSRLSTDAVRARAAAMLSAPRRATLRVGTP